MGPKIVEDPIDGVGLRFPDITDLFCGTNLPLIKHFNECLRLFRTGFTVADVLEQVFMIRSDFFNFEVLSRLEVHQQFEFLVPARMRFRLGDIFTEPLQSFLRRIGVDQSTFSCNLIEHSQGSIFSCNVGDERKQLIFFIEKS